MGYCDTNYCQLEDDKCEHRILVKKSILVGATQTSFSSGFNSNLVELPRCAASCIHGHFVTSPDRGQLAIVGFLICDLSFCICMLDLAGFISEPDAFFL